MATKVMRKIVKIDEDKCDGCGLCVPSCAEGAIQIIDGKAKLLAENLCDGLGNCLGDCPRDAITIEERPAEDFDEQAVEEHLRQSGMPPLDAHEPPKPSAAPRAAHAGPAGGMGGCPGSAMRMLGRRPAQAPPAAAASGPTPSRLGQWPVQLALLPVSGPLWENADVLIAADCTAFAMGDFHERMLAGRTLAIACPKLDHGDAYVHKLAQIIAGNEVRSITVARMEVPCCGGLLAIVQAAIEQSGKRLAVNDVVVSLEGQMLSINGVRVA